MVDAAKLKTEFTNDPLVLGYHAAKSDQAAADLGNSLTGAGAATVTMASTSKNQFLKCTVAAAVRCATCVGTDGAALAAGVAAKWNAVLAQAQAADPGSQVDLTLVEAGALGSPVADKVMTQAEYDAMTKRIGSRFEAQAIVTPITDTQGIVSASDISGAR